MANERKLYIGDISGKINEVVDYINQLERERDEAIKRVKEWNASEEIRKTEQECKEAVSRANMGFAPTKEVWEEINTWEDQHASDKHPVPEIKEPRKYIPGLAHFRYEFENTYQVEKCRIIRDTEWEYLEETEENMLTLITYIENQPEYRRCIQAVEKEEET